MTIQDRLSEIEEINLDDILQLKADMQQNNNDLHCGHKPCDKHTFKIYGVAFCFNCAERLRSLPEIKRILNAEGEG